MEKGVINGVGVALICSSYGPLLGRFLSAGIFVQSRASLQSYNRHSYVFNNPFSKTDPTRFITLGEQKKREEERRRQETNKKDEDWAMGRSARGQILGISSGNDRGKIDFDDRSIVQDRNSECGSVWCSPLIDGS